MREVEGLWPNISRLHSINYVCGYCETKVGAQYGLMRNPDGPHLGGAVRVCPDCGRATYFETVQLNPHERVQTQTPGPPPGEPVHGLGEKVGPLYNEARKAAQIGAHTAAVMACRGILLYVAHDKQAPPASLGTFNLAITFLSDNGWVPPNSKEWVKRIKDRGNAANHDIELMGPKDSDEIITFTRNLLRFAYEVAHDAENFTPKK